MDIAETFVFCLIIILQINFNNSDDLITENSCSAEDVDETAALSHWYSQVYSFVQTNRNVTEHLIHQNEQLRKVVTTQNEEFISLHEQLGKLQQQLASMQDQESKCESDKKNIVIQRRIDGSEDFYRTWEEYKQGFGNASGEFFIGLEKLHKLTNSRPHALLVVMEDWSEQRRFAKYDFFAIGSESEQYKLKELGKYTGTAGDSLTYHKGQKFSTKDRENDNNARENCATWYKGAWWYDACHMSNLNGLYIKDKVGENQWAQGIHWHELSGHGNSLKFVEMTLLQM